MLLFQRIETWTYGKCELAHWVDVLDVCDDVLRDAAAPESRHVGSGLATDAIVLHRFWYLVPRWGEWFSFSILPATEVWTNFDIATLIRVLQEQDIKRN